jgi:DNA-binding GntR family transcriptional regulator
MLYEALADAIRDRIFRHELAPGDALDEFLLAKNYVVSRTPIREALKVLAAEGIVELRARRGSFVARLA